MANRFGMGYNAAVWHECRMFAVEFLEEARDRLNGKASGLLDQAITHYRLVTDRLESLSKRYPFIPESGLENVPKTILVNDECLEAAGWLEEARDAESAGLSALQKIVAELTVSIPR